MTLTKKQLLSLIFLIGLVFSIFVAIFLVKQRQELRKKAAGVTMTITLYPVQDTLAVGQSKVFELKATFTNGSSTEKLDYLKTELTFNPNYIKVPDGKYIDTSASGFGRIIWVDEPTAANEAGKIILELGALSLGGGPTTDKPITIAKLYFEGKGVTPSSQDIKIDKTQVVNSQSSSIDVSSQGAKYSVSLSAIDTPTPSTPASTSTPTPSPTSGPSVTPSPTSACSGESGPCGWGIAGQPLGTCCSGLTCRTFPDGGVCELPATTTATPIPTPPSGEDKYIINVGDKQWLTINIGAGPSTSLPIRFKAKLSHVQKTPEMYLKLRVKDELAFMISPTGVWQAGGSDACSGRPFGTYDFWIPVKADKEGMYSPNSNPSPTLQTPPNAFVPPISPDGWVMLPGVSGGKYYSFYLKGPKTRSTKAAEHIQLQPNEKQNSQDFDWTGKTLDPGDLPDPNRSLRQDCTVNSIDLSLITARLGKTDPDSLAVADVNYDGVVNGNDVSKVVNTLSTKPDDDI